MNEHRRSSDKRWGRWRVKLLVGWIVVFTAMVILSLSTQRNLAHDNKHQIERLEDAAARITQLQKLNDLLTKEQIEACVNYLTLRESVNGFHNAIDKILVQGLKEARAEGDKERIKRIQALRETVKPVTAECANLRGASNVKPKP